MVGTYLKQNRIGWNFRRDKNVKSFLKWKSISFTIELENHLPPTFLPFFKKSKIQKFWPHHCSSIVLLKRKLNLNFRALIKVRNTYDIYLEHSCFYQSQPVDSFYWGHLWSGSLSFRIFAIRFKRHNFKAIHRHLVQVGILFHTICPFSSFNLIYHFSLSFSISGGTSAYLNYGTNPPTQMTPTILFTPLTHPIFNHGHSPFWWVSANLNNGL